jgi:hypothetical protein
MMAATLSGLHADIHAILSLDVHHCQGFIRAVVAERHAEVPM